MMVYDDEGRSVVCESWNVPADYVCLLAGGRGWKCGEFAVFRIPSFEVNVGECTRYVAYVEMCDYYSADDFEMIEPNVYTYSFGECLRLLFAGAPDGGFYGCDVFSDDEIREVLFSLGGERVVAAYESGVSLDDIFAGW